MDSATLLDQSSSRSSRGQAFYKALRLLTALCSLQMPLWDELWWHDGLLHSQPVLDGTLEPQLATPVSSEQ
jgi:hypothetical protein